MASRLRVITALAGLVVVGCVAAVAFTAPDIGGASIAAPERDSAFGGSSGSASGSAASANSDEPIDDRAPSDDGRPVDGGEPFYDGESLVDAEGGWTWALFRDISTGEVRKYRIDADGRATENTPEEDVAVDFLAAYLDRAATGPGRFALIRPFLVSDAMPGVMRDPFFLHPPARYVTGAVSAMAGVDVDPAEAHLAEADARVVLVGTDIGDYRVAVVRSEPAAGISDGWRVRSVLPPVSWLR